MKRSSPCFTLSLAAAIVFATMDGSIARPGGSSFGSSGQRQFSKPLDSACGVPDAGKEDAFITECLAALDANKGAKKDDRLEALRWLGTAYYQKGDFDHAITVFTQGAQLETTAKDRAYWFTWRGEAYAGKDDFARATEDLAVAIKGQYDQSNIWERTARMYLGKGDTPRALATVDRALRISKDINEQDAAVQATRAEIMARSGDLDGALKAADTAIGIDAESRYGHAIHAYVIARKGQIEAAKAEIGKMGRDDDVADRVYGGEIKLLAGDGRGALAEFEAALNGSLESKDYLGDSGRIASNRHYARLGRGEALRMIASDRAGPSAISAAAPPPRPVSPAPASADETTQLADAPPAIAPTPPPASPMAVARLRRVALVVGNGAYVSVASLPNPVRDAQAIAAMFRGAHFDDVIVVKNASVAALRHALGDFADKASDADVAVVFYAGHGIEVAGRNYLIPVDAHLNRDFDVEDETVSLDRVIQTMDAVHKLKLVILDACRENPFLGGMRRTIASRAVGRGLARPDVESSDVLVAYAAGPGSVAADGDGQNSPFTTALLRHLVTPDLDVRQALGAVRDDVRVATQRRQQPFISGSLGGGLLTLAPGATGSAEK